MARLAMLILVSIAAMAPFSAGAQYTYDQSPPPPISNDPNALDQWMMDRSTFDSQQLQMEQMQRRINEQQRTINQLQGRDDPLNSNSLDFLAPSGNYLPPLSR